MPAVWTIGYQHLEFSEFVAKLKAARIETLVDLRAKPSSANYWYGRTTLQVSLALYGIDYMHLAGVVSPRRGCLCDLASDERELLVARYRAAVVATADFALLKQAVAADRTALMCFEADESQCIRGVLAELLRDSLS